MNELIQIKMLKRLIISVLLLVVICTKLGLYAQSMKVVLIANWNDKACGVAEHSRHFARALREKGVTFVKLDSLTSFIDSFAVKKAILRVLETSPDIVNIQYHPGLYSRMNENINSFMRILKHNYNIPTIVSYHSEEEKTENELAEAELFIYYFKSKFMNQSKFKSVYIPLPAPIFRSSLAKAKARKNYGYLTDDIILSTCGFAMPHKRLPEIIHLLASFVKSNSKIKLQLLISPHQTGGSSLAELGRIQEAITYNGLEKQVYLSGKFLKTQDYLERLFLSDVGFSWCPVGPYDSSAIEKDFVAVRVPLVINDVGHNQLTNGQGVIRVNGELEQFVFEIISLSLNAEAKKSLKKEMQENYLQNNYSQAAHLHLKYFQKLIPKK